MNLGTPRLQLVLSPVGEEIRRVRAEINAASREDITDIEDCLLQVDMFEAELKAEYERLRLRNNSLLPYDVVAGRRRFRKI